MPKQAYYPYYRPPYYNNPSNNQNINSFIRETNNSPPSHFR